MNADDLQQTLLADHSALPKTERLNKQQDKLRSVTGQTVDLDVMFSS